MANARDALMTAFRGREVIQDGDIADALLALIDSSSLETVQRVMHQVEIKRVQGKLGPEWDGATREALTGGASLFAR